MVRKTSEQGGLPDYRARKGAGMLPKSVLSMPTPVGLNTNDQDQWFHFCLPPKLRCFLRGKEVFCGGRVNPRKDS